METCLPAELMTILSACGKSKQENTSAPSRGIRRLSHSVAFNPLDGETLASGSGDGTVRLWEVSTGNHLRTFEGHRDPVYSMAFHPNGQTLASGSGGYSLGDNDNTVRLWEVSTGNHLRTLGHTGAVHSVAFSPLDGQVLASGSGDGTVRLWEVSTGNHLKHAWRTCAFGQ